MGKKRSTSENELRKRAEKKLKKKPEIKSGEVDLSSEEGKRLIHELQVHQIELEMQNEELRRAQAELLDSQRRYADLFNFAPLGYVVVDFEGIIMEANQTAVGMLGATRLTVAGKPLSRYLHPSDRGVFLEHKRQAFSSPQRARCVVRMMARNDAFFYAQLESARFEEEPDRPPSCLTAITDISKLKKLEKERENYIRDLEGFSYSASHELRAPLISMAGFSRILREDYATCLDDKGGKYLEIIIENAKKMDQLLSDLLEFSRIGIQKTALEEIDVASLAKSAYGDIAPHPTEGRVTIDIGPLPPAIGDVAMIRQVFVNLLSNALKFTNGRSDAVIEVRGQKGKGENIYSVRDNGAGFDMEYAHKLFHIFQRLHSGKEFPGTGAGLSIVKRVIEKHGGRVWAEGKPGKGATFYFTLPSAPSA